MEKKLIDIEKLFAEKNPRLLKWLPGFLIKYLKRIIHQEEVNKFVSEHNSDSSYEFCKAVIPYVGVDVSISGKENIPKSGGCIFVCNHPLGGMDAMALVEEIYTIRPDMKFIVNDLLLHLPNLKGMFQGVNKHGSSSADSLKQVNELFNSETAIFLFPAGLVSRRKNGKVEDLEWKKTFITRAKKINLQVVPIHIEGRLSSFFYNLSNFRERIGLKINIEMLYLVNELYKQKGKKICLTVGDAISPEIFTKEKTDKEWAEWVKNKTYNLVTKNKTHV